MDLTTSETTLRVKPTAKSPGTAADVLFFAIGECALGKVLVARGVKGVCAILLGDDPEALESDLAARFPKSTLIANEIMVRGDMSKVIRYAARPSEGLDLTLDMRGTPLQRRIWEVIRAIPPGQTKSYMQIARLINSAYPMVAARSVGNACAANPLALAIPCHRVIRSDGKLAGYRWGLERKRELIEKEAVV
jgi:methylated-DNA-[protein]-cysteine S-methyltransferase/AraC family transcriptional regulator of adaptative response/methylated-DNA-[protein]-cysteine methyltransferase